MTNNNYNYDNKEIWTMVLEEMMDADYSNNVYNENGYPSWYTDFN